MIKKVSLTIIGLLSLCLIACDKKEQSKLPKVVTTIGMITDITKEIGGETFKVTGLMGAGLDPHTYVATESDVTTLAKADLIFYNGLYLEAKLTDILKKMRSRKTVIAVTQKIPESRLLKSKDYDGLSDPHVWLDVELWNNVANVIKESLIKKYPQNKQLYLDNYKKLDQKLKKLHLEVVTQLKKIPQRKRILVTAHDAFSYFGKAYGVKVEGLQGLSTESKAGTKDVQNLVNYITKNKIKTIFVESAIPERTMKAVQRACSSKNWNVKIGGKLYADAMGIEGTKEGTYIGMIEHNLKTIIDGLNE